MNPIDGELKTMAERELSSFFRTVTELYGSEQAEASTEDWLRELMARNDLPVSAREWRTLTIAAGAKLASRVNASAQSPTCPQRSSVSCAASLLMCCPANSAG